MSDSSLQGRLADFTLEEILQLMALQQKTGLLRVDASHPMALYFEQGILVSYRDRRGAGEDPLESFLKRYGFFPQENWEHIDFVQRNSQLDLTEILVNESLLTQEELEEVQREAAQEHICLGMQLRDGRYHFSSGRGSLMGLKGRGRMKVEGLLMESVRRIDEMPGLKERYYSDSIKIRRTSKAVDPSKEGPGARRVLAVCGTESTVAHIVSQARMSEFDTLNVIEQLCEQGIVALHDPAKSAPTDDLGPAKVEPRRASSSRGPAIGLALGSMALALVSLLLQPMTRYSDMRTSGVARAEHIDTERVLTRIHAALQLYEHREGRYPTQLEDLSSGGLFSDELVEDWVDQCDYEPGPNGLRYRLATRGN